MGGGSVISRALILDGQTRIQRICAFILAILLVVIGLQFFAAPARAANSTTSCGTFGAGVDLGDLVVTPLHGKAFYTDLKNGVNATYVGYSIKSDLATNLDNIWVSIDNFRSGASTSVLNVANSADANQPVLPSDPTAAPDGRIAAGGTTYVYFLLKASDVSASAQTHDIRIYKGNPATGGTSYGAAYNCYFSFSAVTRTLAASANKVTSVSVDTTTPKLGGLVTVTVNGATGVGGAGDASLDADAMWLSPASVASWPTRALRLETTKVTVKYKKNDPVSAQDTYSNTLLVQKVGCASPCKTAFKSGTTYTAEYKFRVIGTASSDALVKPVAQIASGTQMKHTSSYPTSISLVNVTTPGKTITVAKSIDTSYTINKSGSYWYVRYKILMTNSGSADVSVDEVLDDPDSSVTLSAGTVRYTDKYRTSATLSAEPTAKDATGRYHFVGPFTVGASSTANVIYVMKIPVPAAGTSATYKNQAYGMIGASIFGSTTVDTKVTECPFTINADGTTNSSASCTTVDPDKLPQTISFPQPPAQGAGTSYTLDATASSGLAVTYTVESGPCTVSGSVVVYTASGTCVLNANQAGNTTYDAAPQVQVSVTVLQGQTITFGSTSSMATSSSQNVTITASSGLYVTLTSLDTTICKVGNASSTPTTAYTAVSGDSNVFKITSYSAGNCPLVASQAGNGTYGPALSVDRLVGVGLSVEVLTTESPAPASSYTLPGGGLSVNWNVAVRQDSNTGAIFTTNPVTYTSLTPAVCTAGEAVAPSGATTYYQSTITASVLGLCIVQADQDGTNSAGAQSSYGAATPITVSFTIGATPTVSISVASGVKSDSDVTATVTIAKPAGLTSTALAGTLALQTSGYASSASVQSVSVSLDSSTSSGTQTFTVHSLLLPALANSETIYLAATFSPSNNNFGAAQTASSSSVSVYSPAQVSISLSGTSATVGDTVTATVTVKGNTAYGEPAGTINLGVTGGGTGSPSGNVTLTAGSSGSGQSTGSVIVTAGNDPASDIVVDASYAPSGSSTTYFNSISSSVTALASRSIDVIAANHTVHFDGNGGSGSMADQTTNTATALRANSFTRTGYHFSGWATSDTGPVAYANQDPYSFGSDATLYAVWTIDTYTVTYAKNDGGATTTTTSRTYGDATALTQANPWSRTGYTFQGWSTNSGASTPLSSYTVTAAVTLYAVWTANPHTLAFDTGVGGSSVSSLTVSFGSNLRTQLNSVTNPTRTGYTFSKWQIDGADVTVSQTMPDADVTATAVWTVNTHTVSFNNGAGATTTASVTGVSYGADLDAVINLKAHPTRTGYTWNAWQISGVDITSSETMPDADVTVTSRWSVNTHTVSFDTGAGGSVIASFDLSYGSNLQSPIGLQGTPSRIGYTFSKWQISGADITSSQTMPDADVVVTAVWTINRHSIVFDNGVGATTTSATTNVAFGSDLDALINLKSHPTRTGYTWAAWQISGVDITSSETMPDEDVTVTSRWVVNTYTVSFSTGAGASTIAPVTGVEYNSDLDALVSSQTLPTKTGYTFSKWQISGGDISAGQTMPANDVTVTAVWTVNRHSVIFDTGVGATTIASVSNVSYGSDLDAVINAKSRPTKTGYTWAAWQFSGVDITSSETMPDDDVTVTVRWTVNTYTVSFSNGAGATTTPSVSGVQYLSDLDALVASKSHPTRTGYTFDKWQISGADITPGQTMPANNVTVTAVWTVNAHDLAFDTGADGSPIATVSLNYGDLLRTQLTATAAPTRTGYTFSKWQIGGLDVTSSQTMPDYDLTAVAIWIVNTHTVSFDTGTGASLVSSRNLAYGADLQALVASVSAPSRPGYQFAKWQQDGFDIASGTTMPDEDVTITAVWSVVYTLTYHANGGVNPPSMASTTTDFTAAAPGIMRWTDHAFVKWNTQDDGLGIDYYHTDSVPNSVTDLYAVWVLSGNVVQAITYVGPSTQAVADSSVTVAPQTDADGLEVDLTSDTPEVCTVSGFVITFVTAGVCTTTATQPGDATYSPADPVSQTFRIIQITTEHLEGGRVGATYSSPQSLAGAAGGGIWSTSSALPAGLSVNQLTGTLEGEPEEVFSGNVTFSYSEDGATATLTLLLEVVETTVASEQAITFAQPRTKPLALGRFTISPVTDAMGLTVAVQSQTPHTCTVSGFTVTFLTVGLCTLTASQPGNGTYQAATPVVRSFRIIKLLTSSLPAGRAGAPYRATQTLGGARGNGYYSTSSKLPSGLSLTRSTGVLSGIPTEVFDRTITIAYTEDGASTSVRLRLSIFPGSSVADEVDVNPTPTPTPQLPDPASGQGDSLPNSVDIGRGVKPVTETPKLDQISRADIENLQIIGGTAMPGYKPSTGVAIDIVGAKTLGVFTVVPGNPIDVSSLAQSLLSTGSNETFVRESTVSNGSAPTRAQLDSLGIVDGDEFFFKSAGLGLPRTLAQENLTSAKQWVRVSVTVSGLRAGSTAYLIATSEPIIFGQVTVDQYGRASVSGAMPMDILPAGVHRIRVVANRDIGTITSDESGSIVLTAEQTTLVNQFDEGTYAAVRIQGENNAGGHGLSIRVIPIEKNIPWWMLWVFGALVILTFGLRRRRVAEGRLGRVLKRVGLGALGVVLLIAGQVIEVPAFWIIALVIAVVGLAGSWFVPRRSRRDA